MKIAIYSRKSKFTGIGDSIENQISMCKDFAKSKFSVEELDFDEYEDEGFTGSNLNRPKFKELMKNIKNYDVLICYRLDRISRNVSDFSATLEILQVNHCDFISIKEQFDTSSPMGRAMIYIASVFAQLERETIAERVKDNMLEMGKNGLWTGGRTPLGYNSESATYIDDEGNERKVVKLVPNEEDLKLVRLIYDTYLNEGSLSQTEIWFTVHNIKSRSSILFEKTSLSVILQNPVYVKSTDEVIKFLRNDGWNVFGNADNIHGLLSYNKTESIIIKGKQTKRVKGKSEWIASVSNVPGIIDPETWLKVQKQIKKNKDLFPHLGRTQNALLTGKIRCAKCGNYMKVSHGRISKKTGKKLFYYVCSMKVRSKGALCKSKNLKAAEIEESVLNELEKIGTNRKKFIEEIKKKLHKTEKENNLSIKKNIIEKQISEKSKQIDNLVTKISLDDSVSDIFIQKIKTLKSEITDLNLQLQNIDSASKLENEENISLDFIERILQKCTDIRSYTYDEQKKIINLIVDNVYYNSDTNEVTIYLIGTEPFKKN